MATDLRAMRSAPVLLAVLAAAALLVPAPGAAARTPPQPPLPTVTLKIGETEVTAEVADEPHERTTGMMGRTELADGAGMLFVFPAPQALSFWMRDTLVPLSVAYINGDGVIREIHDLKPLDERPAFSSFRDLVYALEVPQGWFARSKVAVGDRITGLPSPSGAKPD